MRCRVLNFLQDLDVDEMREKFFANGTPEARRVEKLERKIEEIEADDTIANALRQRDEAQDECVCYLIEVLFTNEKNIGLSTCV